MRKHLSDDDLLDLLYEIREGDPHLRECRECGTRWEKLLERRRLVLAGSVTAEDLLARQRHLVLQQLGERPGWGWSLRPAAALGTVGLMLLAIVLSRPQPAPRLTAMAGNDSQLFQEIYSIVEVSEPSPVAPIYGLFEEMR